MSWTRRCTPPSSRTCLGHVSDMSWTRRCTPPSGIARSRPRRSTSDACLSHAGSPRRPGDTAGPGSGPLGRVSDMSRTCPGRVLRLGSGPLPSGGARGARARGGSASASSQQPPGRQHILGETRRLSAMRWSSRSLVTRLNLRSTRQAPPSAASRREAAPALPMQLRCRVNSQGAGACLRGGWRRVAAGGGGEAEEERWRRRGGGGEAEEGRRGEGEAEEERRRGGEREGGRRGGGGGRWWVEACDGATCSSCKGANAVSRQRVLPTAAECCRLRRLARGAIDTAATYAELVGS